MAKSVSNKLSKYEAEALLERIQNMRKEREQLLELDKAEGEALISEMDAQTSMVGARVQHKKWGIGVILEDCGSTWLVDFNEFGVRKLDVKTLFLRGIANTSNGEFDEAVELNARTEATAKRRRQRLLALALDIVTLERRLSGHAALEEATAEEAL